jgi:hypothetical protein
MYENIGKDRIKFEPIRSEAGTWEFRQMKMLFPFSATRQQLFLQKQQLWLTKDSLEVKNK